MLTRHNAGHSVVTPSQHGILHGNPSALAHRLPGAAPAVQKPMEFRQMCFYFDRIDQVTLTKYSAFILKFGGRIVQSIDELDAIQSTRITHIISERHLSKNEFDDMQRRCILRPRKLSAQEVVQNGGHLGNADYSAPSNQMLPSITSATTTNPSFDSASNILMGSQSMHPASQQNASTGQPIANYALFTPVTSNSNSIPSSAALGPCTNSHKLHHASHSHPAKQPSVTDENAGNGALLQPLMLDTNEQFVSKKQFDVLQFAQRNGIVVWSKDELRACLLIELKRYENSKLPKSACPTTIPNESKGLAEYLAEERKLGVANRNAVTNINISTHSATRKMMKCDELSMKGGSSLAKCTNALPTYSPGLPFVNNGQSFGFNASSYHVFKFPFILIEDASQECKPIFKEYSGEEKTKSLLGNKAKKSTQTPSILPKLNLKAPPFVCPFLSGYSPPCLPLHPKVAGQSAPPHRTMKYIIEEKCRKRKMTAMKFAKQKGKPGFCECCYEVYTDLEKHSKTSVHRSFALCDKNYADIDRLLVTLQRPVQLITPQSPKSPSISPKITHSLANACDELTGSISGNAAVESSTESFPGIQSLDDTECTFTHSELLKSPCVRAKRARPEPTESFSFKTWDLTTMLDENNNRNCVEPKRKRQRSCNFSLSSGKSTEIVGRISSLLQVISNNAERRDDDFTVHELK